MSNSQQGGFGRLVGAALVGAIVPTIVALTYISNLSNRLDDVENNAPSVEAVAKDLAANHAATLKGVIRAIRGPKGDPGPKGEVGPQGPEGVDRAIPDLPAPRAIPVPQAPRAIPDRRARRVLPGPARAGRVISWTRRVRKGDPGPQGPKGDQGDPE